MLYYNIIDYSGSAGSSCRWRRSRRRRTSTAHSWGRGVRVADIYKQANLRCVCLCVSIYLSIYLSIYIYIYTHIYIYICICIYIERERGRERERACHGCLKLCGSNGGQRGIDGCIRGCRRRARHKCRSRF